VNLDGKNALVIRPANDDERPLILSAWLRYETQMPAHEKTYGMGRRQWIEACALSCLARGLTLVATPEGYEDVALGFVCAEPPGVVHYLFVKPAARRIGIAAALLRACKLGHTVRITHRPRAELRARANAHGTQWKPLTKEEL
jgi:GNAT superfamily N-acetyltransferase